MSEVAFTVMDLEDRGRADLAHRFLNAYLERTGDYAGLAVLPFYLAYRALVRAKIARLRAAQLGPAPRERGAHRVARLSAARRGVCGAAAAGADHHLRALGLRQDDDIAGVARDDRRGSRPQRRRAQAPARRCRARASRRAMSRKDSMRRRRREATYDRLRALARDILDAGPYRDRRRDLSPARAARSRSGRWPRNLAVPFVILAFEAQRGDAARAHRPTSGRGRRCVGRRSRGARAPDRDAQALLRRRGDTRIRRRAPRATAPVRGQLAGDR